MNTRIDMYLQKSARFSSAPMTMEEKQGWPGKLALSSGVAGTAAAVAYGVHQGRKAEQAALLARKGMGKKILGGGLGVAALGGIGMGLKHMLASGGEKAIQGLKETAAVENKIIPAASSISIPKPTINVSEMSPKAPTTVQKLPHPATEKMDKLIKSLPTDTEAKDISAKGAAGYREYLKTHPLHETAEAGKHFDSLLNPKQGEEGGVLGQAVQMGKRYLKGIDMGNQSKQLHIFHEGANAFRDHLKKFDYPYDPMKEGGTWAPGGVVHELVDLHKQITGKLFDRHLPHTGLAPITPPEKLSNAFQQAKTELQEGLAKQTPKVALPTNPVTEYKKYTKPRRLSAAVYNLMVDKPKVISDLFNVGDNRYAGTQATEKIVQALHNYNSSGIPQKVQGHKFPFHNKVVDRLRSARDNYGGFEFYPSVIPTGKDYEKLVNGGREAGGFNPRVAPSDKRMGRRKSYQDI